VPTSFTGKQILLDRAWLVGASIGVHVDGPWFYVRIGAELYQNPNAQEGYTVRSTNFGWIAAGPRFSFGPWTVGGGVRIGAVLQDVLYLEASTRRARTYSGLGAVYGLEVGASWRPLRWFQADALIAQDLLGPLTTTTFALTASVGWSAVPR
jgi:hypothetical protein